MMETRYSCYLGVVTDIATVTNMCAWGDTPLQCKGLEAMQVLIRLVNLYSSSPSDKDLLDFPRLSPRS